YMCTYTHIYSGPFEIKGSSIKLFPFLAKMHLSFFLQQQESFLLIFAQPCSWKLLYSITSLPVIQGFPVSFIQDKFVQLW
uniref:Uncharacterized protein n=1 Tax=Castor canadensis TaxID=51338 RepID=A0A8C0VZG7_CASCN